MNNSNFINRAKAVAHAAGKGATKVLRTQLYGTRPQITSSASDALSAEPAAGTALHSVFDGPKKKKRGAPALKRQRSA
jgi:hypothetical protein